MAREDHNDLVGRVEPYHGPMKPKQRSTEELIAQRTEEHGYGDYKVLARIEQDFKEIFRTSPNWGKLKPHHKTTLDMIAHKMARALTANPNHQDHWDDIAGYAKLVSNEIHKG